MPRRLPRPLDGPESPCGVDVGRSVPEVDLEVGCHLLLKGDLCEHESDTNRIVPWGG